MARGVLLIVPGLDGEGALFAPLVERLGAEGIAVDVVTHCDDSAWADPEAALGQLQEQLRSKVDEYANRRIVLLGESFGSMVALTFARENTSLAGLILCGGFGYLPFWWRRRLLVFYPILRVGARLLPQVTLHVLSRLIRPLTRRADPKPLKQSALKLRVPSGPCLLTKVKLALDFDARPWLGEIQVPTHIVAGTGDLTIPHACAKYLAKAIPKARLHLLYNLGHLAHHADVEPIQSLVRAMLDEAGGISQSDKSAYELDT